MNISPLEQAGRRFVRVTNLPVAALLGLLQRTPVIQAAAAVGEFVLEAPVGSVLRTMAVAAGSLGALNSLAGATALAVADTSGPVNGTFQATVGTPIPTLAFNLTGTITETFPQSWTVAGMIPPGLSFDGLTAPGDDKNAGVPTTMTGTPIQAGTYTMTLTGYENAGTTTGNTSLTTSSAFSFTIDVAAAQAQAPVITTQPVGQTINTGSTVVFTAVVTGATGYQWHLNGVALNDSDGSQTSDIVSGSGGPQLVITKATAASVGSYSLVATNGDLSASSNAATLQVASNPNPGFLVNISSRAFVGTGPGILIGGFYIGGSSSRTVLIQALGPALANEGVPGTLQHPVLSIYNSGGTVIYSNAGWGSNPLLLKAAASAYANPVLQPDSADSEALLTLPPGGYTAEVAGANNATGVALCAIYQLP